MKRYLFLLLVLAFPPKAAFAQSCGNDSTGLPPINDLGTGFYRGFQGGLYPDGQNVRPAQHDLDGLTLSQNVVPRNATGQPDLLSGKIGLVSIGMSNTQMEFGFFQAAVDSFQNENPALRVVNGAQGGQDINHILDTSAVYWDNLADSLRKDGLTRWQVQVLWFKEAEAFPPLDVRFPDYPDELKEKFKLAMNILREMFPNAFLCYVSGRIYGGYNTTLLNPEPHAYYAGWAVKRLIEDQINGDQQLRFKDPDPLSPWLAWGPYLWADGATPRNDGLAWFCPDDFFPDGAHPSNSGREKVSSALLDFFTQDVTAMPWFLQSTTGTPETSAPGIPSDFGVANFPNPFNPSTTIEFRLPQAGPVVLTLHNVLGQELEVISSRSYAAGVHRISYDPSHLGSGVYYYVLSSGPHRATGRMVVMR